MKRQQIINTIVLSVLIFFFSLKVHAQSGTGELPITKPTPAPTPATKNVKRPATATATPAPAPVSSILTIGEERKGKLDPNKSGAGNSFEDLTLSAKSEDMLTFHLESANPSLGLQILDRDNTEIAVAKNTTGDFKINTPTGGVPDDGDYRVRVTGLVTGKNSLPYKLKVNRIGLTTTAYAERFQKIYSGYRESDPVSVADTLLKLEELGNDDASRSTTFEMLGIVYLQSRKNAEKAGLAMEQAIKANGAAVVKISFDTQWRRMTKLRSGDFGFEAPTVGWLRIRPGQLTILDTSNKTLASLNGQQIKELTKTVTATYSLVTITADNSRKPFIFAPGAMQVAEADLVIKLIQNHVMGKTN